MSRVFLYPFKNKTNAIALLLLMIIAVLFLYNSYSARFIQDDAFTSIRYAQNLVDGKGLVFNEGEKVEGFTSPLWVILLAIPLSMNRFFKLNINIELAAQLFSLFFSVATLILTYFLLSIINSNNAKEPAGKKLIDYMVNLIPVFLLAFSTPLIYWGVSGMETSFFTASVLATIYLFLRGLETKKVNYPFVLSSIINFLIRPEGAVLFGLLMIYKIICGYLTEEEKRSGKKVHGILNRFFPIELQIFLIAALILVFFRLVYYGYPLPNTFYAKTEFSVQFLIRGIRYFADFAKSSLYYGIIIIFPLLLLRGNRLRHAYGLLIYIIFLWIVFVILIGGDVLPVHRFFLPVLPVIYILFVGSVREAVAAIKPGFNIKREYLLPAALLLILIIGYLNYCKETPFMMEKRAYERGLVTKMSIYADWINAQSGFIGRKLTVALSTIGSFSYYSNARVIDLVGLTDRYIAHHPMQAEGIDEELPLIWKERHYNAEYILRSKPDYIIFPAGAKPSAFAECAVFINPEFKRHYFTQIFYSEKLHQLLPIFTRIHGNLTVNADPDRSDPKFVRHYIEADNLFLKMIKTGNVSLLNRILSECDSITFYCPARESEALTIKGFALYHAGIFEEAENFLVRASESDPSNSIARFYLKNIYFRDGRVADGIRIMREIKRFSPDALLEYKDGELN